VFYLATPPSLFASICENLSKAGLVTPPPRGAGKAAGPLKSARDINAEVGRFFQESQIYRIDHYLGKETVQNLLALRFGNAVRTAVAPRMDLRRADHHRRRTRRGNRLGYYDTSGALRDMLQNHLLQLLCIVAMEPPVSIGRRRARRKAARCCARSSASPRPRWPKHRARPVPRRPCRRRGRAGYRDEADATPFAHRDLRGMKAEIDTWRWAGVPFYLRTGKRMADSLAEIVVRFKRCRTRSSRTRTTPPTAW
jgi:glucose-6-phosphate 1-dehydrogenase